MIRAIHLRALHRSTMKDVTHKEESGTRDDEWTGTELRFELAARGAQACELDFRHVGISRDLVAAGWDRFLSSLAAYAEHGEGTPYGA